MEKIMSDGDNTDFSSVKYWENRYMANGTSGAGSYGRLARFKADVLNNFVRDNNITTVLELGCGDGAQLRLLELPYYVGVDASKTIIERCKIAYENVKNYSFLHSSEMHLAPDCDLSISLDVIFHLIEDAIFEKYILDLFALSTNYVIIYSSDHDQKWSAEHVLHRHFSKHIAQKYPEWVRIATIPNYYPFSTHDTDNTSFADFHFYTRRGTNCIIRPPRTEI
jgi:SAM-dependent methyltransferase